MVNKKAGFWIRLAARLFDMIIVGAIAVGLAFALMDRTVVHTINQVATKGSPATYFEIHTWIFKGPWAFYVWAILFMAMIFTAGIGIPLITKGSSLGQLLFKIKVVSKDGNFTKGILKREVFFTFSWLFTSLLVLTIINHTLIDEFARTDKRGIVFTEWEDVRIGIVTGVGSIIVFIQMIVAVSGLVRADKTGLHDVYAKTSTIRKNKFTEKPKEAKRAITNKRPEATKNNVVEWVQ